MIKKSIFTIGLLGCSYANGLTIYNGWNLVGTGNYSIIMDEQYGGNTNTSIVWKYNNSTKTWEAYSSDSNIKDKISLNCNTFDILESDSGYWVCNDGDSYTINNDKGVTIKSLISNTNIEISFDKIEGQTLSGLTTPNTIYIKNGTEVLGQIKYTSSYGDKEFHIIINNTLYKGVFPIDDTNNGTSSNALLLQKL